jgi:hypothetical protein
VCVDFAADVDAFAAPFVLRLVGVAVSDSSLSDSSSPDSSSVFSAIRFLPDLSFFVESPESRAGTQ